MEFIKQLIIGAIAAFCVECFKLYELRGKTKPTKFKAMLRAIDYWLVVCGMCFASGFFAIIIVRLYADSPDVSLIAISAIGAGSFVRKVSESFSANKTPNLGSEFTIRDMFN